MAPDQAIVLGTLTTFTVTIITICSILCYSYRRASFILMFSTCSTPTLPNTVSLYYTMSDPPDTLLSFNYCLARLIEHIFTAMSTIDGRTYH